MNVVTSMVATVVSGVVRWDVCSRIVFMAPRVIKAVLRSNAKVSRVTLFSSEHSATNDSRSCLMNWLLVLSGTLRMTLV